MKKIVRLTESELNRIVERSVIRAINEGTVNEVDWKGVRNTVGAGIGAGLLTTGAAAAGAFDDDPLFNDPQGADQEVVDFLGDNEYENEELPDTIHFDDVRRDSKFESRIKGAVMESINKLMNGRL